MLEGQVAVLSSGYLSPEESLAVLGALKRSALYRPDQHSYILYPDRSLPRFVDKNIIPPRLFRQSVLLKRLVADRQNLLVEADARRQYHFNGSITNAGDVARILDQLSATGYARWVKRDRARVLDLFERVFDHQSFTGRSGTFFGYEGLGCIYWHMVSKLLLATQETLGRARDTGALPGVIEQLAACYRELRKGIGDHKTPAAYGAFPMDPYSHTPAHAGARQPGLTGQVKEDILCRFAELGVSVRDGQIHFHPQRLDRSEFLPRPADYDGFTLSGRRRKIRLPAGSLAFSFCQVPIVYRLGVSNTTTVFFRNRSKRTLPSWSLDAQTSRSILDRLGEVDQIIVGLSDPLPAPEAAA
jgi:hypothetical protein